MIRARTDTGGCAVLRVGDEPRDLARARLLHDVRVPRKLLFPGKGEAGLPTMLDGEDAEWVVTRLRTIPPDRVWLRDLAALDEDSGAVPDGPVTRTALKEIGVLLASARRSAAHDLSWAFEALGRAPEEVRRDARLRAFREECNRAVGVALKARPVFAWRVALVTVTTAESVEDIVAARWRDRLGRYVILAANPVYAEGRVVYAFRSPPGLDGAAVLLSALPRGEPPPRTSREGASGRGALDSGSFLDLLERLRFRDPARLLG